MDDAEIKKDIKIHLDGLIVASYFPKQKLLKKVENPWFRLIYFKSANRNVFKNKTVLAFRSGFLNLGSPEPKGSAALFVGFRGKIKKIKNILAEIIEI